MKSLGTRWKKLSNTEYVNGPYRVIRYRHPGGEHTWSLYWHLGRSPLQTDFITPKEAMEWIGKNWKTQESRFLDNPSWFR